MPLEADTDQDPSSSTLSSRHHHFLIVPSFNPERRHSWGNLVSCPSNRYRVATSAKNVAANADSNER